MNFWDSSAIVPLIVAEENSDYCLGVLSGDPEMLIWCLSRVEVISALCRRVRETGLSENEFRRAKEQLNTVLDSAYEVTAVEKVRSRALRLLEVHPLRATDACQLAAVLVGTREEPERLPIVCFDQRLASVAIKEGFIVNPG